MVLESLINPFKAEQKPYRLLFYGFLYTTVAMYLALTTFEGQASVVFVFLTVMASIPLMYNIINEEEKKDVSDFHEVFLLKEHGKALKAFIALFVGVTLSVTAWYVFAPINVFFSVIIFVFILFEERLKEVEKRLFRHNLHILVLGLAIIVGLLIAGLSWYALPSNSSEQLFESQTNTINKINSGVTGMASRSNLGAFSSIFFNNVQVLIFCILFSFIYGAGAIFVLVWNASVIGTAIGNYIRTNLASVAHLVGAERAAHYLNVVSIGLFKYVIHGFPEILAYFVAALAGGIISVGVIKHDFKGRKFEHIVLDAADLLLLSLAILLVAAVLEVWVTPLLF